MDIDVYKLHCSTSIADCSLSLLILKFGNRLIVGLLHAGTMDYDNTFVVIQANYGDITCLH